jgi:hypothetical protein
MFAYSLEMANIEHRAVIKFLTVKGLNVTEINKDLDNIYKDSAPPYDTIVKWMAEIKQLERG